MLYGGLKLAGFLVGVWAITWSIAALFASVPWWVSIFLMILIALVVTWSQFQGTKRYEEL